MINKTFESHLVSVEQIREFQLKGLKWTVNLAYHGSPEYKTKLDKASIKPGDIHSLEDLNKLPFTSNDDLSDGYPFPLRSVPYEEVIGIHSSSGTTGKRKIFVTPKKTLMTGPVFSPGPMKWQE